MFFLKDRVYLIRYTNSKLAKLDCDYRVKLEKDLLFNLTRPDGKVLVENLPFERKSDLLGFVKELIR